jgi:hypothetical protein
MPDKAVNPLHPVAFSVAVEFAPPAENQARQFSVVAYGGGIITDHPAFDRVAFDCKSTKVATPSFALLEHSSLKRAGVIKASAVANDIRVSGHMLNTDSAKEVLQDADQGAPWQASVRIYPGRIDDVPQGKSVELNGQTLAGPLKVFRNNRVREVSFCALGADDTTSAQFFSIGSPDSAPRQSPQEASEMDQAEHDRIVADLNTKLTAATATITELQGKFATQQRATRLAALRSLFQATGREFKEDDAAIKPYLEMSEESFAAVDKDLRASKPQLDPNLTRQQATSGNAAADPASADDIEVKASQYIAEQKKLGRDVRVSDAVSFVTRAAA